MGRIIDAVLRGYMEPMDAAAEAFFGLVMALEISNVARLALIGQDEDMIMSVLLVAIIGCNLAWGMADGVMNALSNYYEKLRQYRLAIELSSATKEQAEVRAEQALRDSMSQMERQLLDDQGIGVMAKEIVRCTKTSHPEKPRLGKEEVNIWGISLFFNAFMALPILAIYLVAGSIGLNAATLLANVVGLVLFFAIGYVLDRNVGPYKFLTGCVMVIVGFVMLGIIIVLGG